MTLPAPAGAPIPPAPATGPALTAPDGAAPPPRDRLVLLNPGPVNVSDPVRAALAHPDECHREPETSALLAGVGRKVTEVCGATARTHATVLLTGSGTAALEAVVSSVVPPGRRLLILDNGHYGERLFRIAEVHRVASRRLEFGWAEPIDPAGVERILAADPDISHVAMVHHETSTGMLNPPAAVGEVVAGHGRSLIVDAISSLGAERLDVVGDHIDWCVGTANKCLEGLPGVSFVCAPRASLDALHDVPAGTYYLDLYANYRAQVHDGYPRFTPALQILRTLDVALDLALVEGVPARSRRYASLAAAIRAGLAERGIDLLLEPARQANSITNAYLSNGMTYQQLHDGLRAHGYVIYATQDASAGVFRLANMGQLTMADIDGFFAAFDRVVAQHTGRSTT